jgi:hypothetical protein
LKEAGLIKGDIEGARVCYCIDAIEWETARTALSDLLGSYDPKAGNCC